MSSIKLPLTKQRVKLKKVLNDSKVSAWRTMLMTTEEIYSRLEKKLAEKDCSYPRFRLLFALYFDAPLSAAQIASRLGVSRGNMSSFVKRLEEDGLIVPCPFLSTKGRPKFFLSPKGTHYSEELIEFHFANIQALPFGLSASTRKELTGLQEALILD